MIKKSYKHFPTENSNDELIRLLKIALSNNAIIDLEINSIIGIEVESRQSGFSLVIKTETNYDDYFK